jgi:hypothetical protein
LPLPTICEISKQPDEPVGVIDVVRINPIPIVEPFNASTDRDAPCTGVAQLFIFISVRLITADPDHEVGASFSLTLGANGTNLGTEIREARLPFR